jgi:uncharacterized protein YjiS (DUF1127 family)
MSTLSITPRQRQRASTRSSSYGLFATFKRWWITYLNWQRERVAIAHLSRLSDRELKDIGLHRSQIPSAVRATRLRLACPSIAGDQLQLQEKSMMSPTKTTSPDVHLRPTSYNACIQLFRCPITGYPCEGDLSYLCEDYGCARKGGLSPPSDENP